MSFYPVPENRLFCTIPEQKLRQIAGSVNLVTFNDGHVFHKAGEPVRTVLFPLKGVISILISAGTDQQVEALMVGREGIAGLPPFLGTDSIPWMVRAHTAGEAFVMDSAAFQDCLTGNPCLDSALRRYLQAVLVMLAQLAVCRGAHRIEQRCARWLLTMQDRLEASRFRLTQEFFARTLGVRRASISQAVGKLQELGAIQYDRGEFAIVERGRLEEFACPCYRLLRAELNRLFPEEAS